MTPQQSKLYLQAMERIKARERLYLMDALLYPNMPQKDRRKKHKEISKAAFPENFNERILKTTDLELF
jgi:hypothetical protein